MADLVYETRMSLPRCGSPKINALKTGTRALQFLLQNVFPGVTVMRIDREEKTKSQKINIDNAQIFVATQKIFSYADKLNFSLCYVPNSDTLFNSRSYDAQERGIITIFRLLNLLNNDGQSSLVVKTLYGESRLLQALSDNKLTNLIKSDLADRLALQLPPYSNINYFEKSFLSSVLAVKEINAIVKNIRSTCPKVIAYWQTIKKQNTFVGIISVRGSNSDLRQSIKLVPNNWNIDPHTTLANIN